MKRSSIHHIFDKLIRVCYSRNEIYQQNSFFASSDICDHISNFFGAILNVTKH